MISPYSPAAQSFELPLFALNTNITDGASPGSVTRIIWRLLVYTLLSLLLFSTTTGGQHSNYPPAHQFHLIHEGSDFYVDF